MIAQRSPRGQLRKLRSQSGRQDSNLRPSAPKALNSSSAALGFQAIFIFLRSIAYFLKTNHEVFDHYLTTFSKVQ